MGIGAHQDDLEIMALPGILECFQNEEKWFCGVIVTDGRGSPRDDLYKEYTDEDMRIVRRKEQKKAAIIGEYGAIVQLDYPSSIVKNSSEDVVIEDLIQLISIAGPEVIYTHNIADKHDTHVAVTLRVIDAIRRLPQTKYPSNLYGCEVWRDLDWMVDEDKVTFDVSAHENLQAALLGVYDSQICGGKRYDLATMGRRRANATYFQTHGTDIVTGMSYAMDLTPLIEDKGLDMFTYLQGYTERFIKELEDRVIKLQEPNP
jgi:LmbE family N-acetylglucosaminyl deacetylase